MPATSVTKSSHYVTVQQSSSHGTAGNTRYLSWSVGGRQHYFCSLQGLLRLLQVALLLVIVLVARVGGSNGSRLYFGPLDTDLTGVGSSVGLLIVLLILVLCHLLGHLPPTLMEVLVNLAGTVLLLVVGGLCVAHYSNSRSYDRTAGVALGVLSIIAGVVFLVDLVLSLRNLKFNIST